MVMASCKSAGPTDSYPELLAMLVLASMLTGAASGSMLAVTCSMLDDGPTSSTCSNSSSH